jgi:hypothetical protein
MCFKLKMSVVEQQVYDKMTEIMKKNADIMCLPNA